SDRRGLRAMTPQGSVRIGVPGCCWEDRTWSWLGWKPDHGNRWRSAGPFGLPSPATRDAVRTAMILLGVGSFDSIQMCGCPADQLTQRAGTTLRENEPAMNSLDDNRDEEFEKREIGRDRTFFVRAPSTNAVRRALHRAPGGARVIGRHDRATIRCAHTMDGHSLARHWPVIISRLSKAGLAGGSPPPSD